MSTTKDQVDEILIKYTYNHKPLAQYHNLDVFRGALPESKNQFLIKLIKNPNPQLLEYLTKLKDAKSEHVIKITEFASTLTRAVVICQDAPYGTLKSNLQKCKRLQDSDALFIAKFLLYGHMDMLRAGINWTGNESDIQITQTGVKLSWNGSSINTDNPFPNIIEKLTQRDSEGQGILPFPKSKQLTELIKVSVQNASEMSLHPLLKKKQKTIKKKGNNWMGIREIKNKPQYYQQSVYLAASALHGFCRVKINEMGLINQQILKFYKKHPGFVKILDKYDEGKNTITISEYANDGNIQNYVAKLKSSGVTLKQDQIQFLLYSLIEPIKLIQASPLLSLNTLHIKNLYIQSGIPKIGQIPPISQKMQEVLRDKYDVPDFYHTKFKSEPSTRDPSYDTYSLGILLYKLMYTQYPIFPEGKVHIPTTPSYNTRIKTTLEVFLNEGGKLADIQAKLEISQTVKKAINENKKILQVHQKIANPVQGQIVDSQQNQPIIQEGDQPKQNIFKRMINCLCPPKSEQPVVPQVQKSKSFFLGLEESHFKHYRLLCKIIFSTALYIFLFYLPYLTNISDLLSKTNLFQSVSVSINNQNFTVLTPSIYTFSNQFNSINTPTATTLTSGMNCALDINSKYSSFLSDWKWYSFIIISFLIFVLILVFKGIQNYQFDFIRSVYNYRTLRSNFNISNFILFQLIFALAIYTHYFMFNYLYYSQSLPCFGGNSVNWFSSTQNLFSNRSFYTVYILPPLIMAFVLGILSFGSVVFNQKIPYSKIINPILMFLPFLLAFTVLMRIGAYSAFTPTLINDPNNIIKAYLKTITGIFGLIPQLLILIQFALGFLIDLIFYAFLQKRLNKLIQDDSSTSLVLR